MTLKEWCEKQNRTDILCEWDYDKNIEYSPDTISRGVNTKVWWKCCVCGHSYFQSVSSKTTKNYGCPECAKIKRINNYKNTMIYKNGSLKQWAKEHNTNIINEWDYELNDILPENISPFSHKQVYWRCDKGHSYKQSISAKTTEKQCCPYCSNKKVLSGFNDLKTWCKNNARLDIINAWDCDKNTVLMDDVSYGSNKRVWWRCENGHSYQTTIKYKTSSKFNSCPDCCKNRISFPQQALAFYLSQKIEIIENYKNKKLLQKELDIYIPSKNIAVEYDGNYWHRDTEKDIEKDNLCKQNNILLIRIREQGCVVLKNSTCIFLNNNSYEELEKAIEKIFEIIQIEKPHIDLEKDAIEIYSNIQRYFKDNSLENWCIKNNRTTLLQEWDHKKNGTLNPKNIAFGSNMKVWWKCHKCNHSWVVSPNQRTYFYSNCPQCGQKNARDKAYKNLLLKKGSLQDWCIKNKKEIILQEWDYQKNKLTPNDVMRGSEKRVFWKCSICNHIWETSIKSRINGSSCPICTKKIANEKRKKTVLKNGKNAFAIIHPELLKEWDYSKNQTNPFEITHRTNKKVWWKCTKCGNEWEAAISARSEGRGCPECAKINNRNNQIAKAAKKNSLHSFSQELSDEWIAEYNLPYTPQTVAAKSHLKVWWKCKKCGHKWQAPVKNRVYGSGCPKCRKKN